MARTMSSLSMQLGNSSSAILETQKKEALKSDAAIESLRELQSLMSDLKHQYVGKIELGPSSPGSPSGQVTSFQPYMIFFDHRCSMIDRSTREPLAGEAPGVSPNAVLESIDSGDFLAGVMRVGSR